VKLHLLFELARHFWIKIINNLKNRKKVGKVYATSLKDNSNSLDGGVYQDTIEHQFKLPNLTIIGILEN